MGWELTGDLSGTRTAAVGRTGHSEMRDHNVESSGQINFSTCV